MLRHPAKRRRALLRNILGGNQSEAQFVCLRVQPSSLAILSSALPVSIEECKFAADSRGRV